MSASSKCDIIKLDTAIVSLTNNSNPLYDAAQIGSSLNSLNNAFCRVSTVADLPSVTDNEGRFIYVEDIKSFRYSDGYYWTKDACSVLGDPSSASVLWSWGINGGNNTLLAISPTTVSRCSPGTVAGGGTNWCQVFVGSFTGAAIKTDGTLWTWGSNVFGSGALGDGTTISRFSPGTVAGGGTTWCQVSLHDRMTGAVKTDGTLWTWGAGRCGSMGDGNLGTFRSSPGTVAGGGTTWCQISAGYNFNSSIKTDGTLWTWGCNAQGRLGDGTTVDRCSPGTVAGGGTNWCQVSSTAQAHVVAIKCDGTLWTWGNNCCGGLGDGTTVSRCSPGTVAGGGTTWCFVSNGESISANGSISAIKTDGTLWTWGDNTNGILGNGTVVARCSPGTVAGGGTNWCLVSNSTSNIAMAAIKTDGTLWTWGNNQQGGLGNGTTVNRNSPGTVAGGGSFWCAVHSGGPSGASMFAIRTRGF